ncbi:response regulator transcription factor [Arthrobacter cryoconiti]|uniref:Response regulator transcription factor n=1 Tax=Arthrobacter cryoconiti TaxID=748907 RepID=A0ABV8R4A2_9MICC|nr:response regulator transcription factor [Arthrobacter cryoconiti]MCC9067035.1 response regulator transcription factor [Arthrobacter cryoconiti]
MDDHRVAVVIEDDLDIRELIQMILEQSGFEVIARGRGVQGVEAVREHNPAIIMLDLGLPDIDGFEVARRVRLFSDAYIIMLTARADELDTLMGLEAGADDYVTKPFRPRELRARINAMLRRPRQGSREATKATAATSLRVARLGEPALGTATPKNEEGTGIMAGSSTPENADSEKLVSMIPTAERRADPVPSDTSMTAGKGSEVRWREGDVDRRLSASSETERVLTHRGLVMNVGMRTLMVKDNPVELTRTEFDLLFALMDNCRLVRTKADLVRLLRGDDYESSSYTSDADERTIEVHMANLRRKLGDEAKAPIWIKTVRGVGYRIAV